MAGITDGNFCKNYTDFFGIVCIGAFNLDLKTDEASNEILKRGRKEFIYSLENLSEKIIEEIKKAKSSNALVSVNIRFDNFSEAGETINEISEYADIIELNCHCRQKEITDLDLGQNLLKLENNVITSYSIHYTKLYDAFEQIFKIRLIFHLAHPRKHAEYVVMT